MGKMHDVFHVSLLKRYKDGCLVELDLRYTFPRIHYFAELAKVPGS